MNRREDSYRCVCCGKTGLTTELHVHHNVPLSKFGSNNNVNLVTLCHTCHNKQHPGFNVSRNQPIYRWPRKRRFVAVDIETTGFLMKIP
ncbi:MAG: HNH endonuclease [Chitinophagaceae bacterium]